MHLEPVPQVRDVVQSAARVRAHERVHRCSELDEGVREVRAHEAVGSGDEHGAALVDVAELAAKVVERSRLSRGCRSAWCVRFRVGEQAYRLARPGFSEERRAHRDLCARRHRRLRDRRCRDRSRVRPHGRNRRFLRGLRRLHRARARFAGDPDRRPSGSHARTGRAASGGRDRGLRSRDRARRRAARAAGGASNRADRGPADGQRVECRPGLRRRGSALDGPGRGRASLRRSRSERPGGPRRLRDGGVRLRSRQRCRARAHPRASRARRNHRRCVGDGAERHGRLPRPCDEPRGACGRRAHARSGRTPRGVADPCPARRLRGRSGAADRAPDAVRRLPSVRRSARNGSRDELRVRIPRRRRARDRHGVLARSRHVGATHAHRARLRAGCASRRLRRVDRARADRRRGGRVRTRRRGGGRSRPRRSVWGRRRRRGRAPRRRR